ncbi:MAG: branched-chain amino acid ABC transporter permease [Actinomycetes bacterium]
MNAASGSTTVSTAKSQPASIRSFLGWPKAGPIPLAVTAVVAIALPLVLHSTYWVGVCTLALIWMVLNQSWNLVLGYSGIWNFGQLAIYAIGGYTAALVSLHTGIPWPLTIVVAGVAAMLVSLVLAIPSLRLRGIYVSLLTFGFAEVVRLLVIADSSGVTGGTFGLSGFDGFGISAMAPEARSRTFYWIALVGVAITLLAMYLIVRSPLGTGLMALRDNPALAAARGVSPMKYQLVSFGISGFFAGVAGALYAFTYGVVSPSLMGLGQMTLLVTMLVVGGMGTLSGPLVGTAILTLVQAELQNWPEIRLILLGVILLAIVVLMPRGVVPLLAHRTGRLKSWMAQGNSAQTKSST